MLHQSTFCFGKMFLVTNNNHITTKIIQYTSGHLPETQTEKKERIYDDEHINSFASTRKIATINGLLVFQPALMFSPKLIF